MPGEGRLRACWNLFDGRARGKLVGILALNLVAALLEAVGAGLVVPFIAMVGNPEYIVTQPVLQRVYQHLQMESAAQFQVVAAVLLLAFFVAKNGFIALTTSLQFSFVYREMSSASTRLYEGYLRKPYAFHIGTNGSVLIRNVTNEVQMFFSNVLVPGLTVFSETAVVVALLGLLLWLAPGPALLAVGVLGGLTLVFHFTVRRKVRRFGAIQQEEIARRIQWINQGLGGIKEVKVLGREDFFVQAYAGHEQRFSMVSRYAMVLNQMPRLFIETVAFASIFISVAVVLMSGGQGATLLPTLALFAVAAVRLMPSVNRIVSSITRVSYYAPSLQVLAADLPAAGTTAAPARPAGGAEPRFASEIAVQGLGFTYPGAPRPALQGIDLVIPRGASVALCGPSGSGKTTLADLLLGLLQPAQGRVLVDGADLGEALRAGRVRMGYIPQSIYLCDDTVRRNVAFGLPDDAIDDARVWQALEAARLADHVRALPQGLDAVVGERGVSLSGGQRQRIGIARALYDDPDVLVLDEATSALDSETEREITQAIDALAGRKTLVIIAHRTATIEKCSLRFHLDHGRLVA